MEMTHSRKPAHHADSRSTIIILAFSGGVLVIDIIVELILHLMDFGLGYSAEKLHLGLELFASAGLILVFLRMLRKENWLKRTSKKKDWVIQSMKGDFDSFIQKRFDDWKLSKAERDVALLAARGLNIGDIASARHSSDGTVKAQLGSIYRKAGVKNRTQFISELIDELNGFGLMSSEQMRERSQSTAE